MRKADCHVTVIIPAAGSGTRMGGAYKPLEMLCGKAVISYSLEVFESLDCVSNIVIAARDDKIDELQELVLHNNFSKVSAVIAGGKDRQESVEKAFRCAFSSVGNITQFVAVHDAARPMITADEVSSAFDMAFCRGSAVCASKVRDTVKRADSDGLVSESVDRDGLWLIQTPQVFDTDMFHTALSLAKQSKLRATDDSSLFTYAGFKTYLCETSSTNFKVTYKEDMLLAELILSQRMGIK